MVPPLTFKTLDGLTGLAGLADRSGVDVRPTLLRVLTDLYIQKPSHGAEEERHYCELALRLIGEVDAPTLATVALRLAAYPKAPRAVLVALAPHLPAGSRMTETISAPAATPANPVLEEDRDLFEPETPAADAAAVSDTPDASDAPLSPVDAVARREAFFTATPDDRRLILLNLEFVADPDAQALSAETGVLHYIEQAALAGRFQEFTTLLQQATGVARNTATRVIADPHGEPFAVVARALAMPADIFQRIVMFLNPSIGHSVERVYELSDLFAEISVPAAVHLVAVWREADRIEARGSLYRPLHWHEAQPALRAAAARQPARPATSFGRRNQSRS
jgi:hypothetical protein